MGYVVAPGPVERVFVQFWNRKTQWVDQILEVFMLEGLMNENLGPHTVAGCAIREVDRGSVPIFDNLALASWVEELDYQGPVTACVGEQGSLVALGCFAQPLVIVSVLELSHVRASEYLASPRPLRYSW